ncbi:N-formylglutamate deformylase [Undibacterium sp. TJN25]|uniref:N-formylglutamate deformylase n=1 Tax=Undibacterium sp. TJN25 TaxID=3413056 RepID=UPI003BF09C69
MSKAYHFHQGSSPLLISMPHVGTEIPADIAAGMHAVADVKADTDWHLPLLYNMAQQLGASVLSANYSRYVIDLNRSTDDTNLYPGQDTTGLFPIDTFTKQPLYLDGMQPGKEQMQQRIAQYWQPYHLQLQQELERIRQQHGMVILWDAHSIASRLPRFFEGKLPDLNFGTAEGRSCDAGLQQDLAQVLKSPEAAAYGHVFNGRFKGGHITRHYGRPEQQVHAVQLEMSQCIYMDETAPFAYRPDLAERLQPLLGKLLQACLDWAGTPRQQQQQPVG